ncbi:hypothetical protein BDQ17DRAFT_955996 [Cyathus striatus]|nr:hypothetical protein BDQ17DRAFT_955996 [Cyathus striatus]
MCCRKRWLSSDLSRRNTANTYLQEMARSSRQFSFLWSWFSLTIIYPNTNYTSLLRLFLQRAGSHPLSFEFYEWHRSETPNVTNSVLRFLLEKHDLWKDVDITLAGYPDVLSDITEGYFPVLESVAFVADKAWTPEQRLHVWRVLHSSSAIQRVMLNEFCDSIPWFDVVPWHNLRYLDINMSINPDELLEILKYVKNWNASDLVATFKVSSGGHHCLLMFHHRLSWPGYSKCI